MDTSLPSLGALGGAIMINMTENIRYTSRCQGNITNSVGYLRVVNGGEYVFPTYFATAAEGSITILARF
jgi:hypothetical protein